MITPADRATSRATLRQNSRSDRPVRSRQLSQSTRTTCWRSAMMRVFTVVRDRASTLAPVTDTPPRRSRAASSSPAWSRPSTPHTAARPPSDCTFHATLLAPPGMLFSRVTLTTGTGASGEIRLTPP